VTSNWLDQAVDYLFQHGGASDQDKVVADKVLELFIDSDIYWSTNAVPVTVQLVDAGPHLSEVFVNQVKVFQVGKNKTIIHIIVNAPVLMLCVITGVTILSCRLTKYWTLVAAAGTRSSKKTKSLLLTPPLLVASLWLHQQ
jgi:hypothetical protein